MIHAPLLLVTTWRRHASCNIVHTSGIYKYRYNQQNQNTHENRGISFAYPQKHTAPEKKNADLCAIEKKKKMRERICNPKLTQ